MATATVARVSSVVGGAPLFRAPNAGGRRMRRTMRPPHGRFRHGITRSAARSIRAWRHGATGPDRLPHRTLASLVASQLFSNNNCDVITSDRGGIGSPRYNYTASIRIPVRIYFQLITYPFTHHRNNTRYPRQAPSPDGPFVRFLSPQSQKVVAHRPIQFVHHSNTAWRKPRVKANHLPMLYASVDAELGQCLRC